MIVISDFIAAMAFSQLVLLGMYFLVKFKGTQARLISLYGFCLAAYTLTTMSFAASSPVTVYILFRLATLAPFLLWLISFSMFVDNGKITPVIWSVLTYAVVSRTLGLGVALVYPMVLENTTGYFLVYFVPQIILLYFSIDTIYLAWAGFRTDLVEQRRNVRILFVVVMGILVIAIVGGDFISLLGRFLPLDWFADWYPLPAIWVATYIFLTAFLFNIAVFKVSDNAMLLLTGIGKPAAHIQPGTGNKLPASSKHVETLTRLMREQRLYAQTGLTIADLAVALKMQEYRVRRLINQQLGYRNFNQFLNNYRIEDARELLVKSESPISSIALDVGYASLSVFNKAFKERYLLTPREYRAENRPAKDHKM